MNIFKKKPQEVPTGLKYLIEHISEDRSPNVKTEKQLDEHLERTLSLAKDGSALEKRFTRMLGGKEFR